MEAICQSRTDAQLSGIRISELKRNSSHPPKGHILSAGKGAPAMGTLVYTGVHGGSWGLLAWDKRRLPCPQSGTVSGDCRGTPKTTAVPPVNSGNTVRSTQETPNLELDLVLSLHSR